MKKPITRILLRMLKVGGILLGSFVLLLFLLPHIFPKTINRKIDQWVNNNINGHISFSHTNLSFFKRFPSLTLTMYDVSLKGSAPFEQDTLIAAKEISLGIDLSSVLNSKITINKIFLNEAFINIQVDSEGHANYNIYKSKPQNNSAVTDTNGASLGINKILVENSTLIYNDLSLPVTINARGFNYSGSGDLSKDVFDLYTHTEIASFDFYFNQQPYVIGKKINADLVTEINTKSLTFIFQKNNININQFPVEFKGRFEFLKDGYDMDFNLDSHENDLDEIITALPSKYQELLKKTEISGTGNIQFALTGKYIAKDSIMPDITMNVKVRNGYISNEKSPAPVRNLYMDMSAKLPGLNPDSLSVNVDSFYFNIADGYFSSVLRVKGFDAPDIYARVNSEIDLEKWNRALGIKPFDIKGKYTLHLLAEGKYATRIEHKGLKKPDTVIASIPKFTLSSSFRDGYFKYTSLSQAIKDIRFNLRADCPDNNYKHISVVLDSLNASAMGNYIRGYFKLKNAADFPVDAMLQTNFHLEDIKQIYPIDSLDLKGYLTADIRAKGNYLPAKKKYPVIAANITLQNGSVKTKYYPHPVENIQVSAKITDKTGSSKGLNVSINPVTFNFEHEPFSLQAELHDFTDLQYQINLNGKLDVGKIYQVFARKGYNATGIIDADLSLKGKQSDVRAGHYDKLFNKGTLKVENVTCSTKLYPKPFVISKGVFSFNQAKMQFDTFAVKYAHSLIILNGALSNVIDYAVKPGSVLTGDFNLKSDLIVADDFMAFSDTSHSPPKSAQPGSSQSGVILVPKNLNLNFTADVKTVKYNDIVINDAKGRMIINNDSIILKETEFNLIGAPISMAAAYTSITPQKAFFNYHITAKDFDVRKAYKTIKLFHDLASSAEHAEGLISLDYQLSGELNSNMMPVYPSLKGCGVLSAKKIKMHGFKLFNAVGKQAGNDSLRGNSDVSKIKIYSTIAHNVITIERTRMHMAGFRLRFEGQASFSNALDLKFRLGLPPLGVIGIPMTITGTEDNPKIHVGKGTKEDEIQGTDDDD